MNLAEWERTLFNQYALALITTKYASIASQAQAALRNKNVKKRSNQGPCVL